MNGDLAVIDEIFVSLTSDPSICINQQHKQIFLIRVSLLKNVFIELLKGTIIVY